MLGESAAHLLAQRGESHRMAGGRTAAIVSMNAASVAAYAGSASRPRSAHHSANIPRSERSARRVFALERATRRALEGADQPRHRAPGARGMGVSSVARVRFHARVP